MRGWPGRSKVNRRAVLLREYGSMETVEVEVLPFSTPARLAPTSSCESGVRRSSHGSRRHPAYLREVREHVAAWTYQPYADVVRNGRAKVGFADRYRLLELGWSRNVRLCRQGER
ncbi:hypothetical protein GCM10022376_32100 [Yimella lutea]